MEAGIKIGNRALVRPLHFWTAGIAFLAIFVFKVPFLIIVIIAGIVGWVIARVRPEPFTPSKTIREGGSQQKGYRSENVSNTTQSPISHLTKKDGRDFPWAMTYSLSGPYVRNKSPQSLFPTLPLFYPGAFVTFGGAYAVLAFVSQSAIESYGWLTHGPMMDGFALAETTPGPLILVLQFVGFMAGWNQAGNLSQVSSAVLAGLLTTYSTFLPCFLFIFLGAPLSNASEETET